MASIGRRRLAREVVGLLIEQPQRRADIVRQLAGYLIDTKQVGQLDLLIKDIADELFVQNRQLSADVIHAFDLTAETRQAITSLLTHATGAQSVDLQTRKDPNLLGGVVIKTPRAQMDASVRHKLTQLQRTGV